MAWKGLRDGCPEQYALRAQGSSGEDAEGVGATGSGACKPCRRDSPLLQSGDAGQDGRTIRSRYDYAKSFLGHLLSSHAHACMLPVTSDWLNLFHVTYVQRRSWCCALLLNGMQPLRRLHDAAAQDLHFAGIANDLRPSPDPLLALLDRAHQHRDILAMSPGRFDQ